jgi:signal peptidase
MSNVRKIALTLVTALFVGIALGGILSWRSGYRLYVVKTGSMAPALMAGDAVLDGPAKGTYGSGEIITFRHSSLTTDLVTHRVTDIQSGKIHTKGDANRTADAWDISPDQVQGVVVQRLPRFGYLIVFLRQPTGIASLLILGVAVMLLWGLLNPSTAKATLPEPGRPAPSDPAEDDAVPSGMGGGNTGTTLADQRSQNRSVPSRPRSL